MVAAARAEPSQPLPPGVAYAALDVADPGSVRRLFDDLAARYGALHALVAAAGVAGGDPPDGPGGGALARRAARPTSTARGAAASPLRG